MRERSEWTDVDGVRLHARAWGRPTEGRLPLVMAHGFIVSSRYLVPLGERLGARHHVLAPDLPGFGLSHKPRRVPPIEGLADALAQWMDARGLARAHVLGNSMGCQVLAALAQRHPARVARMVLVGPTVDAEARTAPRQLARLMTDMTRERWTLPLLHVPDYARTGVPRVLQTLRHVLADRIEDRLPHVQPPTLVVRGARDALVPQRWAETVAGLLPRGRLVVLPDAPHVANYTTPDALADVVLPFLAEGDATGLPARPDAPA